MVKFKNPLLFNGDNNVRTMLQWCNALNQKKCSGALLIGLPDNSDHIEVLSELKNDELIHLLETTIQILRQSKGIQLIN